MSHCGGPVITIDCLYYFSKTMDLFLETISSGEADIINNVIVLSIHPETLSVFVIFFFSHLMVYF